MSPHDMNPQPSEFRSMEPDGELRITDDMIKDRLHRIDKFAAELRYASDSFDRLHELAKRPNVSPQFIVLLDLIGHTLKTQMQSVGFILKPLIDKYETQDNADGKEDGVPPVAQETPDGTATPSDWEP